EEEEEDGADDDDEGEELDVGEVEEVEIKVEEGKDATDVVDVEGEVKSENHEEGGAHGSATEAEYNRAMVARLTVAEPSLSNPWHAKWEVYHSTTIRYGRSKYLRAKFART
ncbi:MAG: hypothetical protein LQ346_007892, partial [Caloplaca aetnensis]